MSFSPRLAADFSSYVKYGATVIASGGAHSSEYVDKLKRQGLHVAGSISCLAAQSHDVHANPDLAAAVARDIAGSPIGVPETPESSRSNSALRFGCVNHPAFRAYLRRKVCDAMAADVDGLHIDEHLASAASIQLGGCFCSHCVTGFARYLGQQNSPALCDAAGVSSFEEFDYRALVAKIAPSREKYLSLGESVPLHAEYADFQFASAAANVAALGRLAEDVTACAVSLSANACLPDVRHAVVIPQLTYCACEIAHNAAAWPRRARYGHARVQNGRSAVGSLGRNGTAPGLGVCQRPARRRAGMPLDCARLLVRPTIHGTESHVLLVFRRPVAVVLRLRPNVCAPVRFRAQTGFTAQWVRQCDSACARLYSFVV